MRTYKMAVIHRETNPRNWAVYIDGARRNFRTLRAAKAHVDRVARGEAHQGLR